MALRSRYISLFSGVGGLDLAVRIALPESRCVCYVEGEIPCAERLAARIAEGTLRNAPIWSDVRSFDGKPWRGQVDGIIGGFPCQDLSVAGKRAGIDGERSGLWGEYARIIAEVKPAWVFVENVSGLVSSRTLLHRGDIMRHFEQVRGASANAKERWYAEHHIERLHGRLLPIYGISALLYVTCQLEELGYRVETEILRASDVGAPHKRERVFILAYAGRGAIRFNNREGRTRARPAGEIVDNADKRECLRGQQSQEGRGKPDRRCDAVENPGIGASGQRWGTITGETISGRTHSGPTGSGDNLADAIGTRPQERGCQPGDDGQKLPAVERDSADLAHTESNDKRNGSEQRTDSACPERRGIGTRGGSLQTGANSGSIFPPGPGDTEAWSNLLVREPWMRPAISQAEVESDIRNSHDGLAYLVVQQRTDALRAAGNGVVALQGAVALRILIERFNGG